MEDDSFNFGAALVVLFTTLLGPDSRAGKGSIGTALSGTWKLLSTEELLRDGSTRSYQDLGAQASGYLMYASDGYMCAVLLNPSRPNWQNDEEHATDAEKISAASGFTSYCGRYTVDEDRQVIVHFPEASFLPNYVGSRQERPFRLERDRLIFSAREPAGEVARWTIVWQKVTGETALIDVNRDGRSPLLSPADKQQSHWASDDDKTAQYIIDMERKWAEGVCVDNGVVASLLADDFQGTSPKGERFTKDDELRDEKSPRAAHDCGLDEAKVHFFGDSIEVVYGREHAVGKDKSQPSANVCQVWTDTWLKRDSKWQIIASQDNRVQCK